MKIDARSDDLMDSKFGEQGASAHRLETARPRSRSSNSEDAATGWSGPTYRPARKHPGYNRRKIPSGEYRDPTLGKCKLSLEGPSEPQNPLPSEEEVDSWLAAKVAERESTRTRVRLGRATE